MKKFYFIVAAVFISAYAFSQSPDKLNYQAVIRNSNNALVNNTSIGMQLSIIHESTTGTAVYVETHTTTSNNNGLIDIEIGNGTVVSGTFSTIDWANGPYFIKTEVDPTGGINYTITGVSQILSVPYALYAKTANSVITETDPVYAASQAVNITAIDISNLSNLSGVNSGDQDISYLATQTALSDSISQIRNEIPDVSGYINTESQNLQDVLGNGNDGNSHQIKNIADPTDLQDAATKAYVDNILSIIQALHYGVNDANGNHYNSALIGNQVWMTENLKTTKFNDSTDIPLVTDSATWSNLITSGYCWYKNDSATYANPYGALYNWYAVETNKLCPVGWHVPSSDEWTILSDYLGGESVSGGKLKEKGTAHWMNPNTGATNESNFTAVASGQRQSDALFSFYYYVAYIWSNQIYDLNQAWYRSLARNSSSFSELFSNKKSGFSVRCIKD